jgi:hypothetical protein
MTLPPLCLALVAAILFFPLSLRPASADDKVECKALNEKSLFFDDVKKLMNTGNFDIDFISNALAVPLSPKLDGAYFDGEFPNKSCGKDMVVSLGGRE